MSVTVYGVSDDLIEIEGDIEEEFSYDESGHGQPARNLLAFSDGTILGIEYTQSGVWRITPVVRGSELAIEQAPEDDEENYSDRVTLTSSPQWVVQGIAMARRKA